jgi:hypothetical protein
MFGGTLKINTQTRRKKQMNVNPASPQQSLSILQQLTPNADKQLNDAGCMITRGFIDADRYLFDFQVCRTDLGWKQYDTDQDAWYCGTWYNIELMATFSYVEGDTILCVAPNKEAFKKEMEVMAKFYGDPPPAFVVISEEGITHYIDSEARPDPQSL